MDSVPAEILQEIVSYSPGPDLNSLRLVNRTLSAASNIFRFEVLDVPVTHRGLDNLLNISRLPGLARCVRAVTYPHNHLSPMENSFHEFLGNAEPYLDPSAFLELERLTMRFFDWYTENRIAQIELEDSGECVRTLESAFSRMVNIRAIIPGHNIESIQFEFEKWYKTLTEEENAWDCGLSGELSTWEHISGLDVVEAGQKQVTKAIMDLVNTTHRLEFKLNQFGTDEYGIWCEFFSKGSDVWNCASLFQNLTYIHVCITTALNNLDDIGAIKIYAKKGQLYQFISFAPNLRMLSLCIDKDLFQNHEVEVNPEISLLDILSHDYVWQHLHTFYLEFPNVNSEDLVEFLGRHARTLKCLLLWCTPVNGTWRKVMDCLKERLHLTDLD
ncbi:hypothetical protein RUND412_004310 [Rhizina undulata]